MSLRTNIQDAIGQYITTNATISISEYLPTLENDGGASSILHNGDIVGMVYQGYVSDNGMDYIEVYSADSSSGFVAFGEELYLLPDGSYLSEYSTTSPTKGKVVTPGSGDGTDNSGGGGGNGGNQGGGGNGGGTHGSGAGSQSGGGILGIFDGWNFLGVDLSGWKGLALVLGLAFVIANRNNNNDGKRK